MKKALLTLMCLSAMMAAGTGLKAQEVTIVLNPGWNWISCPMMDTLDFETALGSFTPAAGDIIKSRWGQAIYTNGHWMGSISQFFPGYGYHYKSNRTMPVLVTFNAQQPAPQVIVTTSEPTDITTNSATCGGNVVSTDGNYVFVILRGICWSTNPNPTFNDNYVEVGNGIGSFTASMTDLAIGTTYYVRAFAVTANGTFYGEEVTFTTDHAYIDLGLPSGTLWATFNVGANAPEEYGNYYAWGETTTKSNYAWSTYQYCNGSNSTLTKYCNNASYGYNGFTDDLTTLVSTDDVAMTDWGEKWCMPTKAQWEELLQNTTNIWTTQNGVNGRLFTATNGNSIFLPATGFYNGSYLENVGGGGAYRSSTLCTQGPDGAWYFGFESNQYSMGDYGARRDGVTVRPVRTNSVPSGAINGLFSVSDSTQVYFSQGNLQYIGSTATPYWKFADNQWEHLGNNGQTSSDQIVNRDLFGWGTSGWDCGNTYYSPLNVIYSRAAVTSQPTVLYFCYAYGPLSINNLTDYYSNSDWGYYNAITNGGNQSNLWRTLTNEEWNYVLNTRSTSSGKRFVKAVVNDVNGLILLPDNWNNTTYQLSYANEGSVSFSNNVISASDWNILQESGVVFLPVTGIRVNTSHSYGWEYYVTVDITNVSNTGVYWSAETSSENGAYRLSFGDNSCNSSEVGCRGEGCSIRLVQDYNP